MAFLPSQQTAGTAGATRARGSGEGEDGRRRRGREGEVLALWLGDDGLELGGGECIDQAGLRHNEEQHLRAGEGGELVRLTDAR